MKTKPLTPFEARFALEYVTTNGNGAEACRRAGCKSQYPDVRASQTLKKPDVRRAIKQAQDELRERTMLTAEDIITGLLTEAKGEGPNTTPAARVGAWTALARINGMFTDRLEVEAKGPQGPPVVNILIQQTTPVACAPEEILDSDPAALR